MELDGWEGREDLEEDGGGGNRDQNISYKKKSIFNFKTKMTTVHLTEADLYPNRQQTETEKEPWELLNRKTGNMENKEAKEEGMKTESMRSRLDHKGLERKEPYSSRVIAFEIMKTYFLWQMLGEEIYGTAGCVTTPSGFCMGENFLVKCEILANSLTGHYPFIFPTIGRTLLQATILTAL